MGACAEKETYSKAYTNMSDYTSKKYNASKEYMGPKMTQAQSDYGPQLDKAKINYDIMKMYTSGFVNESVKDTGELKFLTEFEKELPLRNISLNEFERRLKKCVVPSMKDMILVKVVQECFKDHWAFLDIDDEGSLSQELMFDEVFLDEQEEHEKGQPLLERRLYVPWIMLMGIIYCRSNRAQRAEKFYELVEIQLTDQLSSTDKEFVEYNPVMIDICYDLMLKLYPRHRNQTPEAGQPDIDVQKFVPADYSVDEMMQDKFLQKWTFQLFGTKNRLDRKNIENAITNRIFNLLQPHEIRYIAYETKVTFEQEEGKVMESVETEGLDDFARTETYDAQLQI